MNQPISQDRFTPYRHTDLDYVDVEAEQDIAEERGEQLRELEIERDEP